MATVTAHLERALARDGQPVFVTGAPGSGKTWLLERTIAIARENGFDVVEMPAGPRFEVTRSRGLRAALNDESVAGASSPGAGSPEGLDALRVLAQRRSEITPLLVTIDDLHAADRHTVDAVVFLIRHLRNERILLMATSRDGYHGAELAGSSAHLTDIGRVEGIVLDAFDLDEVTELVAQRAGDQPDPGFVRVLHERSGGLPFFVVELLDVLLAAGLDPSSRLVAPRLATLMLPRRVGTAVLHRVFELGADTRLVATAVAVLETVSTERLALLAGLTGIAHSRAVHAFDDLVRANVLVGSTGRYGFCHQIIREALYSDLDPASRRAWHVRAAMLLADERSAAHPEEILEIAEHLRRGGSSRDPMSAQLMRDAGDAIVYSDPRAAAAWYADALARLAPTSAAVPGVQLALGHALDLHGRHEESARITSAALRRLEPGPERERGATIAARAAFAAGQFELAATILDAALADGPPRSIRTVLLRGHVRFWQGRLIAAGHDLAEARARGGDDTGWIADTLDVQLCFSRGQARRAAELVEQLRSRLDDLADDDRSNALVALRLATAFNLDPASAVDDLPTLDEHAAMCGWHQAFGALALLRQGRLAESLDAARRATSGPDQDMGLTASVIFSVQISANTERGDLVAAHVAAQLARASSRIVMPFLVECSLARLHTARGDHERAVAMLDETVRRERDVGRVNVLAHCLGAYIDATTAAGRLDQARTANVQLQALRFDGCNVSMAMRRLIGAAITDRCGETARAARVYAEQHHLAFEAACALALMGDIDHDREALASADREFAALGAATRRHEVAILLRQHGGRSSQRRHHGELLSPDELRIAGFVAEGLTNREVAKRMSLSRKTIEVYLSRIYAATRCRSRVELALAVQRGDVPIGDDARRALTS